jgi:hypothetical protein
MSIAWGNPDGGSRRMLILKKDVSCLSSSILPNFALQNLLELLLIEQKILNIAGLCNFLGWRFCGSR